MNAVAAGPRVYNLFPLLVGTVAEWEHHLDRIAAMNFDWVFLNPFHATGLSGSLYAVADYYRLNPLVRGRAQGSDDDLIRGFVAAADRRGVKVMMDLVINHTAIDSVLTTEHPEWFVRDKKGALQSPFCVDPADPRKKTVWGDLAELDYTDRPERAALVAYFQDMMQHYAGLGIRGFRCDAAYQVPADVWRTLIDASRHVQPECLFAAENLGSLFEQVEALEDAGFDYLFNSSKWWDFKADWLFEQYDRFRTIAPSISFPETHDTDRLVVDLAADGVEDHDGIERCYRRAYLFAAAFSAGVMIPIGFEYGFRHRLHVVSTRPEHWEEPSFDLCDFIGAVNRMREAVPVFNEEGPQRAIVSPDRRVCTLVRKGERAPGWAVTLINLDHEQSSEARIADLDADMREGREVTPGASGDKTVSLAPGTAVELAPGEVRIFSSP